MYNFLILKRVCDKRILNNGKTVVVKRVKHIIINNNKSQVKMLKCLKFKIQIFKIKI